MTPPTPSALTIAELKRLGWPHAKAEHYTFLGDPRRAATREALLWAERQIAAIAEHHGIPTARGESLVGDILMELSEMMPPAEPLGEDGRPKPAGIRKDLWNYQDFQALDGQPGVLAIQATTASNARARVTKICGLPDARRWLLAGNRIEVWAWKLTAQEDPQRSLVRGARKLKPAWALRRIVIEPGMFAAALDGRAVVC